MRSLTQSRTGKLAIAIALIVLAAILVYVGMLSRPPAYPPPPFDGAVRGMVIRDPWYDFGTAPDQPDQPNRAAQDRMGAMLAQMGVQWVRLEFHIEGSDLDAAAQIARNDYFIREVAPRYRLKVLGLLGYGLVRGQDPRILGTTSAENDPIYGSGIDNPKRIWLNRARQIVARYQGEVAAYQVLNEPNRITPNWNETLPAAEVARLHTTFYRFFRHHDRAVAEEQAWRDRVPIILGGLQPAGTGQINAFGFLADTYYLRQLYASDAFVQYHRQYGRFPLDGLGYHPYPVEVAVSLPPTATPPGTSSQTTLDNQPDPQRDLELMLKRLDEVRQVLTEVGDSAQPLWITELGYNAGFANQDAASQAEFLRLVYTRLAARDDVARIFWFKYEDFPPATGPDAQNWGTVIIPFAAAAPCPGGACYDVRGRPTLLRPAFWVYRDLAGVGDTLPEPPAQLITRGPLVATSNTDLTFTASVTRPTVTQPLTYTWQLTEETQVIHRGGLQDSVSFNWQRPGIYTMMVEVCNTGGLVIAIRTLRIYPPGTLHMRGLKKM